LDISILGCLFFFFLSDHLWADVSILGSDTGGLGKKGRDGEIGVARCFFFFGCIFGLGGWLVMVGGVWLFFSVSGFLILLWVDTLPLQAFVAIILTGHFTFPWLRGGC
jgi:hypothetical protein